MLVPVVFAALSVVGGGKESLPATRGGAAATAVC
jgi:hypothetical protein